MRGKIENFDEAISYQNPEIATLLSVARNDDLVSTQASFRGNDNFIMSYILQPY
ncbi:hypothetical protein [Rickettsia hoogstraalii]|uniref:hypothetical protein n=1 Tax=Rickettsia hoogstraalii TaxID=467174 RepID=UPI0022509147|nr:hypothetical protein [Rickettsia hoogstraalii]